MEYGSIQNLKVGHEVLEQLKVTIQNLKASHEVLEQLEGVGGWRYRGVNSHGVQVNSHEVRVNSHGVRVNSEPEGRPPGVEAGRGGRWLEGWRC
jgi:hypothetical protein